MTETPINIPDREWFKSAEVCALVALQPYVLRSWEKEFPSLGVAKPGASGRAYRQSDVELVVRIKQLVFGEGLTLAGVRKRLEGEWPQVEAPAAEPEVRTPVEARKAIADIKSELKSILAILDGKKSPAPAKGGWLRSKGQPTLLDLNTDQQENGERPKRNRKAAQPSAE